MKTRRALSLFLVVTMILSMFTMILPASAAPSGTRAVSATRSRTSYTYYTDEQLMEMLDLSGMSELNTLRSAAYESVMHNTNWDLSSYNYNWNNTSHTEALKSLYFEHPECFFVNSINGSMYNDGTLIYLTPVYKDGYEVAMEQHAALEAAAQEIMCRFQRTELSDLELAILIHDYLVANYEYHLPTLDLDPKDYPTLGKFSAYNLLVEGTAVCQGYAEAYAFLMMQFGINCGLCMSNTLNHAWNIIEIDGKEYQLDATWDDPTPNVFGKTKHSNMLLSTTAFKTSHVAEDFTGNPENTEFDTAFWQNINAPFCLVGDTIYFISNEQKLCTWDHIDTDKENGDESAYEIVELMDLSAKWYAIGNGAWQGYYGRLATDGERLFYSTPSEIREYFPETNTSESVYAPEAKTDEGTGYKYNIFGFHFDGENFLLNYYYTPNFDATNIAESVHIYDYPVNASETHVYGDPVNITFPCEADGEARYDCIYCGFSKFETIPAAGHNWLDATCTEPAKCSVCGEVQEGEPAYVLINSVDDLKDGGQVVIVANANGEYKALGTEIDGKITPINVTVSDNKVIGENLPVWTINTYESGYSLYNGSEYLGYGTSGTNLKSTSEYAWSIEKADGGFNITSTVKTDRGVIYRAGTYNVFGGYSTGNTQSEYTRTMMIFQYGEAAGSALGHTEEVIPGTPATCTEDGLTDGAVCSVCGEIIREQETIKAPGHTEVTVPGKEATCTEDGLTDGIACSVCGETIREQETIDAHGHTAKEVEGSAPTCTEDGKSAHTVCEVCGEALTEVETTPALGHDEIYTPNNDGTHTITCSRGDLSETAECSYTNGVCDFCDYEEPVVDVVSYKLITNLNDIKAGKYIIGAVRSGSYPVIYPAIAKVSSGDWNVSDTSVTVVDDAIIADQLPADAQIIVLEGDNTNGFTIGYEVNGTMQYLGYTNSSKSRTLAFGSSYNTTRWIIKEYSKGGYYLENTSYYVLQNSVGTGAIRGYSTLQNGSSSMGLYFFAEVAVETGECQHPNKVVEEKAPTCVDPGYIKWSCPDCGANGEDPIAPNPENHVPGRVEEDIRLEATCLHEGIKDVIVYCAECDSEYSRNSDVPIPKAPHDYGEDGCCTACYKDAPGKTFYLVSDPLDLESFVLYHPASGYALSLDPSGNKLKASKVTVENGVLTTVEDTAVFTRIQPLDNEFPLRIVNYKGEILTSGETKGNLLYTTEESAYGSWKPVVVSAEDRTFRFENQGSGLALQFYNDQFSAYTGDGDAYIFQIYNSKPVCDHQWDDGRQVKDPTCNEPGQVVYTCTVCGDFTVKFLPTTEHAWQVDTTEEPTCTEDGIIHYTCSNCGEAKEEPIPSKGHSMDEGTVTTEPTCTENGVKTFTCTVCGHEDTETIPSTGHSMEDDTCTVCGYAKPVVTAGQYVIAANVNGTYYAMGNAFASKIAGTSITLTDGTIREDHAEGFVITLAESDGGWTIQNPDGSYLKYASGTNLGKSNTPYVWTFTEGTNGTWRVSAQNESRGLVFRTQDSSDNYYQFGGYAVSNITATGTQYYDIELIPVILAPDAELTSRSISLNGNIAVNFYMSLSDKVVADPDAYMLFKQEGKVDENGNEITVKVTVAECVQKQVRGRTSYVFTYEVAAKEMTDTITAQFFYGDTCTEEYPYSVKTYADNQRQNLSADKNLMNLLDAMLHYGAASQIQFDYHTDRLADAGMEKADYSGVTIDGYPILLPQGTDLVAFAAVSLLLESETTLRYFFRVDPSVADTFTVTFNGTPLDILYRNGLYYVDIKDISAPELDEDFSIIVNDGVQEATVIYCPLSYCQSIRSKDTSADALKNVCAALYLYNRAANSYFEPKE